MGILPGHHEVKRDFLHLKGLPADALANESAVIRLDFASAPETVLLEAKGFRNRKDRTPEPEESSVRVVRVKDAIRLEFVFRGEDGSVDPKRRELDLLQEPYGELSGGDFVLGGETEVVHGVFGTSGRLWTNGGWNFRTSSVFENGDWTYTVDIPLAVIPRTVGDAGAFLANFHRKTPRGMYSWIGDPSVSLESAQGGTLVRLAPQAPTAGYSKNPMDGRHDFRACWTKDFHRIWLEEKGGAIAGAFRLTNTNTVGEVYFHNGRMEGLPDCFVGIPATALSVVSTLKVKGRGTFRFGFMPWTEDKRCLYPYEKTAREFHLDSPDEWRTIRCGFTPRPDGVYAENAARILPSLWLAPGGDILIDDLEIRFLQDNVIAEPADVAFPVGLPLAAAPLAAKTPTMRGAFVPEEWKDAKASGDVRYLRDGRMLYVAAVTKGNAPLSLALKGADGSPFAVSVETDGTVSSASKRPVYAFVSAASEGRMIYRLALPLNLCKEPM